MGDWRQRKRGRYRDAFKCEVVAATLAPGAMVARVARDYGLNANLVFTWRRDQRFNSAIDSGQSVLPEEPTSFLPVEITSAAASAVDTASPARAKPTGLGAIRLTLPGGAEIRIDGCGDVGVVLTLLRGLLA